MRVARFAAFSLTAALTAGVAAVFLLGAPAKSFAGDDYGYYGDGGWYTEAHRDGNVFYNAYNSQDGYARHRYGDYWQRPYDGYGYEGYGYEGGYGYGYEGYGRDGYYDDGGYRRDGRIYYPNYGHVDVRRREIHRTERRFNCQANGGREYRGRCY